MGQLIFHFPVQVLTTIPWVLDILYEIQGMYQIDDIVVLCHIFCTFVVTSRDYITSDVEITTRTTINCKFHDGHIL